MGWVISPLLQAAVINSDWKTNGDHLITRDTSSGLEWLDLTETNGLSRNYVFSQLGTNGLFEGWRYALDNEVVGLWSNFGINLGEGAPHYYEGFDPGVIEAVGYIGNIMCEWDCANYPAGAVGFTGEGFGGDNWNLAGAYHHDTPSWDTRTIAPGAGGTLGSDAGYVYYGHYLVRETEVPEPLSIALIGLGLVGIGFIRKKSKTV